MTNDSATARMYGNLSPKEVAVILYGALNTALDGVSFHSSPVLKELRTMLEDDIVEREATPPTPEHRYELHIMKLCYEYLTFVINEAEATQDWTNITS